MLEHEISLILITCIARHVLTTKRAMRGARTRARHLLRHLASFVAIDRKPRTA
jgi:hypothetical protein